MVTPFKILEYYDCNIIIYTDIIAMRKKKRERKL